MWHRDRAQQRMRVREFEREDSPNAALEAGAHTATINPTEGHLGVTLAPNPGGTGVLVEKVDMDDLFANAGISSGRVLLSVDGKPICDPHIALQALTMATAPVTVVHQLGTVLHGASRCALLRSAKLSAAYSILAETITLIGLFDASYRVRNVRALTPLGPLFASAALALLWKRPQRLVRLHSARRASGVGLVCIGLTLLLSIMNLFGAVQTFGMYMLVRWSLVAVDLHALVVTAYAFRQHVLLHEIVKVMEAHRGD